MSEYGVAVAVVLGVLGVLGIAVTAWVFWPAFKGPEAARQAIGTHASARRSRSWNPGGITPTTEYFSPSSRISRPTMSASPP